MLALMNCSLDLMEMLADESGNVFGMNRRAYLYVTADKNKVTNLHNASRGISNLGAGPMSIHSSSGLYYQTPLSEGFHDQPMGAKLLLGIN